MEIRTRDLLGCRNLSGKGSTYRASLGGFVIGGGKERTGKKRGAWVTPSQAQLSGWGNEG